MKTTEPNEPTCWIGEHPVYPGHPITCALIVLLAYPGESLPTAWAPNRHGVLTCEGELDAPTAGGALSAGCALIQHVREGKMTIDAAIEWGGHRDLVASGAAQAERLIPRLRAALAGLVPS